MEICEIFNTMYELLEHPLFFLRSYPLSYEKIRINKRKILSTKFIKELDLSKNYIVYISNDIIHPEVEKLYKDHLKICEKFYERIKELNKTNREKHLRRAYLIYYQKYMAIFIALCFIFRLDDKLELYKKVYKRLYENDSAFYDKLKQSRTSP